MPKVGQLRGPKDALSPVDHQAIGGEELEDMLQMIGMVREVCAGHEDVIEVDEHEGNPAKDAVHQPLESLGGILEAEGHAKKLHKPKGVMIAVLGMSAGAIGIWW